MQWRTAPEHQCKTGANQIQIKINQLWMFWEAVVSGLSTYSFVFLKLLFIVSYICQIFFFCLVDENIFCERCQVTLTPWGFKLFIHRNNCETGRINASFCLLLCICPLLWSLLRGSTVLLLNPTHPSASLTRLELINLLLVILAKQIIRSSEKCFVKESVYKANINSSIAFKWKQNWAQGR